MSLEKKTSIEYYCPKCNKFVGTRAWCQECRTFNIIKKEKVWVSEESLIKALDCMDMTMEDLEFEGLKK